MDEHPNCQAIETFINQFDAAIRIGKTEHIDGAKADNAYMAAFMNNATGVGFTVVAWGNGNLKCIVECVGQTSQAEHFGKLVAKVIEP